MSQMRIGKIIVIVVSFSQFIQNSAGPIHNIRVSAQNSQQQQQQTSQGTYHGQNGGVNGAINGQIVHSYPSQVNYNNEYADFQQAFQHQQQKPSNSAQNPNRNNIKDDSHKISNPNYRDQQNPQFQNYLYQKQKLDSRQINQNLHSANNNPNERSSQQTTHGAGQVQLELICTSTGCRSRNEQVKINQQTQNQPALHHEMQQPQAHQHVAINEKSGYKAENYAVESNKNFLLPNSVGNNNGNNRANILDARKARALENKDVGQRNIHPYRPHPNSFVSPSALPIPDTKNKGQNSGLVKIEFDFADKDVNDTYETTMELVADEL